MDTTLRDQFAIADASKLSEQFRLGNGPGAEITLAKMARLRIHEADDRLLLARAIHDALEGIWSGDDNSDDAMPAEQQGIMRALAQSQAMIKMLARLALSSPHVWQAAHSCSFDLAQASGRSACHAAESKRGIFGRAEPIQMGICCSALIAHEMDKAGFPMAEEAFRKLGALMHPWIAAKGSPNLFTALGKKLFGPEQAKAQAFLESSEPDGGLGSTLKRIRQHLPAEATSKPGRRK